MEETTNLKKRTLLNQVQRELLGKVIKRSIIIKINNENLAINGEIFFPANLLAWRGLIPQESHVENCTNILEYYLHRKHVDTTGLSKEDILKKAGQSLVSASEVWPMRIQKCCLQKDRVCLFLNRNDIIESTIKKALICGIDYGKCEANGKSVCLKINEDKDSDLTTTRLRLIQEVSQRILVLRGFKPVERNADYRCLLTTKSQGHVEEGYQRCVCGVVKNQDSNSKETLLTWEKYVNGKREELVRSVEGKLSQLTDQQHLQHIAEAIVAFELLCVKSSRPVFIQTSQDSDRVTSSSKGGSFVLYNVARISAILERFKEEECLGNYPSLSDINNTEFSQLNQEEEWELVYNFILAYPEMIEDCIRTETSLEMGLQTLCLFLSHLSQKFSVYYRRIRILTEGRDHLVPTMMARLHLLRALHIVINNSLGILNIVPVSHM